MHEMLQLLFQARLNQNLTGELIILSYPSASYKNENCVAMTMGITNM